LKHQKLKSVAHSCHLHPRCGCIHFVGKINGWSLQPNWIMAIQVTLVECWFCIKLPPFFYLFRALANMLDIYSLLDWGLYGLYSVKNLWKHVSLYVSWKFSWLNILSMFLHFLALQFLLIFQLPEMYFWFIICREILKRVIKENECGANLY
jgi:hypothetical protein